MNERLKIERKRYQMMEKRNQKKQTLDLMIAQREWVEDGMDGLMAMMKDSFPYYDSLICLSCYQPLSCHQYSWALGYALASLWVMTVNARSGCIEKMTMKDYHDIEDKQFHLASDFKTSATYSFQIVKTTDIIALYVKYIRKHVIPEDIDGDDSVLFPNFKGTPLCQGEVSRKVRHHHVSPLYLSSLLLTLSLSITRFRMFSKDMDTRSQSPNFGRWSPLTSKTSSKMERSVKKIMNYLSAQDRLTPWPPMRNIMSRKENIRKVT